ncbi:microtubule-actin cross-linking factor 1, isoforms 1/2/3/4-like isoform X7 [Oppia nitens]|uniref:microtubule-actin cross-linking factor 1, isoforms 1/2/3/4-like isoform X7 n=1 Tax=Oppia nitens TaxID=1686743 RepID=UPI0023DA8006|nr:microtubule-actin cross-linking factor 1, isoforms 1/2/3/4-like isoform X7 [Oppia nitens]
MESNNSKSECRLMWKFLNHVNSKTVNTDINTNDVNDVNDVNHQTYEPIYKLQMLNTIEDERDAIQKKTFTKWVNKHLIKHWIYTETYTCLHVCNDNCFTECNEVTKGVVDLFEDLRDGHNLISLLEVLSGEILSRERGRMRVHMLQNIQICLDFLKRRKIKLVNIRADDIVDGNPKLTLGLIWTIILHFQLSDIVLHDDTQSFKEALLRWAQKTTEGYPGVNVKDFTQSWRDGLAFNAILHRNRPDLLDYRSCRGRTARENLENAFHVADKDLGVTRLLDPEDVDTPHPDEKSLITYISSLYELFPEPPEHNPLLDLERIRRIDEYKDLASRLCVWMRESIVRLREKNFPNTLQEMKVLQQDNNRFRTEEIPPKLHDKQRLASSYKDIIKMVRALPGGHHRIEEEYKIENIEHQWNKVITAHSERDHAINEEIQRLERLHRLAEKLLRDIKQCDIKLDDIERQIVEEEKRVQRLHPLDTKFNIDKIEAELRDEGERIQSMFKDVQSLREGRYHKATELHNRVQQLHQRWSDMKLEFQTRVVELLAQRRAEALKKPLTEEELIAKYHSFRFIHECILWVQEKHKKLESLEYGHDLSSVKDNLDQQKVEHRSIEQFQSKVDQCDRNKLEFKGEEYEVYCRMLNRLNKGFSELIVFSNKRLSDLDTLLDFVQSASNELKWLTDKEDVEVSRDWSSKTLNLVEVEQQHRQLISDMERREHQFNIVQERGESLIRQRHPATKCIEGLMARMQSQWSWLLQLINCLEVHSKNAGDYHQFFNEARDCDQWLAKTEDKLNTTYSKQNFSLEEGEQLLKEMNRLKEDITRFGSVVNDLVSKSKDVHPLKQRRAALPRPVKVRSVCLIKQDNKTITKNESVTLHDNSRLSKWRITTSTGAELNVPGVCFVIPPPDQEAIDTANDLRKRYEALVALWARKQHKLRQNMIFATLKIVKGWDYPTYCAMDPHQRDSILRALDDDIDKICREGPSDDPGNQRLRDEMDALRKKFAEFDARRRAEEEEKSNSTLTKKYTDAASNLLEKLLEKERILVQRCQNPIPRNRESLEQLVVEHKEWEIDTKSYESEVQRCKELFQNIPQKSPTVQRNYDEILEKWNSIWNLSQLYIERLKTVETVLFDLEKASQVITKAEIQLASGDDMPADEVALRRAHNELIDTQNDIQRNKSTFEELTVSITKVRRIVERTRSKTFTHSDVNRLEDDVKNLIKRLDNCGETLIERLRLLEACADLLRQYKKRMDSERSWISQIAAKVNTLLTRPDQESAIRLNEQLVERKPSIEDTNASGARFIREAKIHDLKIKSYRENLEDSHPSLDASAKRSRRTPGADIVIQELDQLNSDYKELLENMQRLLNKQLQEIKDQLTATLRWLSDTEEEMANQKPISADYQVVKAQLQEQKLFKKLITDKETSVRSLLSSAKTLIQSMDSHERAPIEKQMHEITRRFDALLSACNDRMASLEQTLPIARAFAERIGPLGDWLESSERKLAQLSTQIPTDQNRIRKRIQEHESLHRDIIGHKRDFEELTEIAQNLMSLIGDDEAQDVVERLQRLTDRYAKLVEDSIALGQLLSQSHEVLGSFVLSFEDILAWIQEMESRLNRYRVLSVFVDKLKEQVDELTELSEEIHSHQKQVSDIVRSGQEIMKHSSGGDSIFIKEKLDSLQSRFSELTHKATEKLMQAKESLPICQNFHKAHNNLNAWMDNAERELKNIGSLNLSSQEKIITKLEKEIPDNRTLLETLNHLGPQLSQISPGQGAATIEGFVTRASRRFDAICEQIQRKAERIEIEKQRNNQILVDIDELLDWFRDAEKQLLEAEPITPNPDALAILLKETKALNDDINSQKGRVRDVITNAKKLLRESSGEDLIEIRDKAEDLRELANHVSQLCQDRLNALEQALPLAIHFFEAHIELSQWLDEVENEAQMLGKPGINATQIRRQQEMTKSLIQSIAERKPLVDKLNKTGAALMRIIYEEDARQVQKIMDSDNDRYNRLKNLLREQQQALEAALQAHSQFADKLDGMLNALNNTADQLRNAEPIAAHPDRIREQIVDNNAIINDLDKKAGAVEALKSAARDVISKAGKSDEPAIRDIRKKLDKLNDLWDEVQKNSKNRDHSLNDALKVAEKFWNELNNVMKAIYDLQDTLNNQEPPATEPNEIKQQQHQLKEIKHDMDQTKPEVDHCKQTGRDLLKLCGEPDKPEVKKHLDDLDNAWDNVTSLYAKREKNLIDAMDKAMNFHEMLRNLFNFLDKAEHKYESLGPIAGDIDTVKRQQRELKEFQHEVNQHMVEIEALNRAAHELLEDVSPDQARSIRGPVNEINRRWDELLKNINDRQTDLDNALLRLGQFQHALNDFLQWITKTERTLDEMRPVFGDPPVIEVELAKHKVLMNDILAHQSSLDSLNIAGKQMLALERDTESARSTKRKLEELNSRWEQLIAKAHQRQRELEDALREAQGFNQEIQNLLAWLNDVDAQLSSSKPVGGLPETAREQLNRFMELYTELEATRPKVESVLKQGEDYLRRSTEGAATNLQHNVKTLRQRWENVLSRANDRKIKLEIALREATEFHEALQEFVDWLTSSEKYLTNLQPVSRIVDSVLQQIEEHKNFQKDIAGHRETMLNLDKKGTHLKYFSQKQDVILIKNLLVSVQHRWERVVSKAAERTRALDHGFKEAKEFLDAWTELMSWLSDAEKTLDSIQQMSNNPELIKQMLLKHKEFQRSLGAKQSIYDATIKLGRTLKEKAPKSDGPTLQDMIDELKNKWNSVCNKSVDRQRKLEEALLYSGQFKDAIQALIDWLDKAKRELAMDMPVYGDLDTVTALVENHKTFQEEFKSRAKNLESVRKTSRDLLQTANAEDARHIKEQMSLLENKWEEVSRMSEEKQIRLEDALRQAEQLHKSVHMLLEWLSDAEMKLRFAGPLPEDEATTRQQIAEHERFMREMAAQEKNKDATIALAQEILQKCHPDATPVIRHWITIIQSRWEEVAAWAQQREQRLQDHLRSLKNIMDLLEELLAWLIGAEASLLAAEAEPLPDDVLALERLIEEHQRFIDDMIRKEPDVEKVAKAFTTKRTTKEQIRAGIDKGRRGYPPRTSTPTRGIEPEIKHPRARELLEKWSTVWKLAMDRMKRLQDKLNYNRELDRMRNFDFDEWRRRFLGWMNNKKARIMDFFRKIDTDNDGKVTKSEFVEGFLNSKFPTSRLEMTRVVDIFDRNNDGYVDQKEYLDTLRPDRDQPKTEAEIIEDEVQRQVNKCNCLTKYKVHQVGEGRYRFGESQKLRLVRILRSTVMVRVGGGWVSLDEFLVKNDPCRAKGRTNVELREQFILAEGVSQSMTPFKSKSPIRPDGTISTTGPITKIREKSERSVPMSHSHHYRYGNSTSDYSFSDQADSSGASKGRPISRLTVGSGSKPNSRPGSRHSSRPSSRAGSDMSVESLEGYQQRRSQSVTRTKLGFTSTKTNGTNGRQEWKNY